MFIRSFSFSSDVSISMTFLISFIRVLPSHRISEPGSMSPNLAEVRSCHHRTTSNFRELALHAKSSAKMRVE